MLEFMIGTIFMDFFRPDFILAGKYDNCIQFKDFYFLSKQIYLIFYLIILFELNLESIEENIMC